MIRTADKGSPEDKLRLAMVYYLSLDEDPPKEDVVAIEAALSQAGAALEPFQFCKKYVYYPFLFDRLLIEY